MFADSVARNADPATAPRCAPDSRVCDEGCGGAKRASSAVRDGRALIVGGRPRSCRVEQGFQIVDGGDHRAAERGVPAEDAFLHRAADALHARGNLGEGWQLCHRRRPAQRASHALHCVGVRTSGLPPGATRRAVRRSRLLRV